MYTLCTWLQDTTHIKTEYIYKSSFVIQDDERFIISDSNTMSARDPEMDLYIALCICNEKLMIKYLCSVILMYTCTLF